MLKKLCISNNLDFLFLSESWMPLDTFPSFGRQLGLKLFVVNGRLPLSPNLWCFLNAIVDAYEKRGGNPYESLVMILDSGMIITS